MSGGGFAGKFVGRQVKDAGHGFDGAADFPPAADEEREDELGGAQLGLADEAAQGGGLAQSSRAVGGELADKVHGERVIQNLKFKIKKSRAGLRRHAAQNFHHARMARDEKPWSPSKNGDWKFKN